MDLKELLNIFQVVTPFLHKDDRELFTSVYTEAKNKELKSFSPVDTNSQVDGKNGTLQKYRIIEENLKAIFQNFRSVQPSGNRFLEEFPKWNCLRLKSVQSLKSIGEAMHTTKKNCNISKLVGTSTSLLGGVLCVTSAILIPFTAGLSTPLLWIGGATAIGGSTTTIGTSVTERCCLKSKIKEAEDILEQDRSSFKVMDEWLVSINDTSEAIDTLLNALESDKVLIKILQRIETFLRKIKDFHNLIQKMPLIKELIHDFIYKFPIPLSLSIIMKNIMPIILLLLLLLLFRKSICKLLQTIPWEIVGSSISGVASGILSPAVSLIEDTSSIATTVARRSVFAAVGIGIDIANVVLTSIDLYNGSVSEQGQQVVELSLKLENEAKILEEIYLKLWVESSNWEIYFPDVIPFIKRSDTKLAKDSFYAFGIEAERIRISNLDISCFSIVASRIQKYDTIEMKLRSLTRNVGLAKSSRDSFIEEFPNWKDLRLKSIHELNSMGKQLSKVIYNSNKLKLYGVLTYLFGGCLCMLSIILALFMTDFLTRLIIFGVPAIILGQAIASKATEMDLFYSYGCLCMFSIMLTLSTTGFVIPLIIFGGATFIFGQRIASKATETKATCLKDKFKETDEILRKDKLRCEMMEKRVIPVKDLCKKIDDINDCLRKDDIFFFLFNSIIYNEIFYLNNKKESIKSLVDKIIEKFSKRISSDSIRYLSPKIFSVLQFLVLTNQFTKSVHGNLMQFRCGEIKSIRCPTELKVFWIFDDFDFSPEEELFAAAKAIERETESLEKIYLDLTHQK